MRRGGEHLKQRLLVYVALNGRRISGAHGIRNEGREVYLGEVNRRMLRARGPDDSLDDLNKLFTSRYRLWEARYQS